jgi:hypothetical protein
MEFRPLFYAYLILCVIVFFQVVFTLRKNSLLKICFLLIISSLFVMNYYSYISVSNRLQFVLVKCTRIIYVCSTMLAVIQLVTPKIPRWIIGITMLSVFFLIGLRIHYFNEIVLESQAPFSSHIFSVGPEFHSTLPVARYAVFALVILVTAITFYYYRQFIFKMNREDLHYRHFCSWIISMVVPFYLLVIFGLLGNLRILEPFLSPYLFSVFSCMIIFSILFRPKLLNTTSYFPLQPPQ